VQGTGVVDQHVTLGGQVRDGVRAEGVPAQVLVGRVVGLHRHRMGVDHSARAVEIDQIDRHQASPHVEHQVLRVAENEEHAAVVGDLLAIGKPLRARIVIQRQFEREGSAADFDGDGVFSEACRAIRLGGAARRKQGEGAQQGEACEQAIQLSLKSHCSSSCVKVIAASGTRSTANA